MTLELMDWKGRKIPSEIGEFSDIVVIDIAVISGDEVATVIDKNYRVGIFDTAYRCQSHPDGGYRLYDFREDKNLLFDEKWKNRKSTYWFLDEEL